MKIDNSPPRGTRDLLPDVVAKRDYVLDRIAEVYHRYGYRRIETPAVEDIGRLTAGQGGENEKLVFRILRRGLDERVQDGAELAELVDLGLRFDLTVPLTRFYGNNHTRLPLPFRSFQFGPVWRAERPQQGRYRQFSQCDIDIIGEPSILAEVELIEATAEALAAVDLRDTTVRISDRRLLAALAGQAGLAEDAHGGLFVAVDKLDKIGWDGVRAELVDTHRLPKPAVDTLIEGVESLRDLPAGKIADALADAAPGIDDAMLTDLSATIGCLDQLAAGGKLRWDFDPTLARGMGYYTGQIFEIAPSQETSSVAGGGRYDRLIGRSLDRDVPACGFSIGFERLVDLLDHTPPREAVAVLYDSDVPATAVLALARQLRSEGRVAAPMRRHGKLGTQLGRLEDSGFTSVVHLRDDSDRGDRPVERRLGQGTQPQNRQ